ncbi:MAG: WD40 repeat domain-containing serine/threonine-protein kinase [Limisphaerales bacterium]
MHRSVQPPSVGRVPAQTPPRQIEVPEHRVLCRIGSGSYGEVWLATSVMGTFRAIKVVFRRSFEDDRPYHREFAGIQRFEPISRSHEGFVDILQVGQGAADEYFYCVMELGDDLELGQAIDPDRYRPRTLGAEVKSRRRLPVDECVRLGLSLCSSLEQLHKEGLVHRDIKPSNIIFVNGVPKLADIGLVADLGEARSFVGTIGFVPPEGPGTERADIYSLGKVLYEASTGQDRHKYPELPAELADAPDARKLVEFNEVIFRACHHEAKMRYPSAREMADDLLLLNRGKSVMRLHLLERRMALLARTGVIAVAAVLVVGSAVWGVLRDRQFRAEIKQRQIGGLVADGTHALQNGDLVGALPMFVEALRLDNGDKARMETDRLRVGLVLSQCPKLVRLWSLGGEISDVEFSADGRRVVIGERYGGARVFDATTGEPVSPKLGQFLALESACFSPDGRRILTVSQDQSAALWDAASGRRLRQFAYPAPTYAGTFCPDGHLIALGRAKGLVEVYDAESGILKLALEDQTDRVEHVAFSHNGLLLVSCSIDGTARVWDLRTGAAIGRPFTHKSWVKYASFRPDDRQVVTACLDYTARVWDVNSSEQIAPPLYHHDQVYTAAFSPDGQVILTAGLDSTARLWDAITHQPLPLNSVLPHSGRVTHGCFNPEGNRIALAGVDGCVAIWDLAGSAIKPSTIPGSVSGDGGRFLVQSNGWAQVFDTASNGPVSLRIQVAAQTVALNRNGHFLIATTTNRAGLKLQVWAVDSGQCVSSTIGSTNASATAVLDDSGKMLAILAGSSVDVFDTKSGTRLFAPLRHDQAVSGVVFNSEAAAFATVAGNKVRLWALPGGQPLCRSLNHFRGVTDAEFSPDGRYLVTSCTDDQLTECYAQVWDAATGIPVGPQFKHHDGVTSVSFSRDSRRLITAGEDRFATLRSLDRAGPALPALEHASQAQDGTFSQNGLWVATGSHDRTARVWDAATGVSLGPPLKNGDSIIRVRFIAQDYALVTVGKSGESWLWRLPSDPHPAEDLLRLCSLIDPNPAASLVRDHSQETVTQQSVWERLRAQYPELFAVSPEQLATWHDEEARTCEEREAWRGALVHLDRLASLKPGDTAVQQRRETVLKRISEQEGAAEDPDLRGEP